MNNDTDAMAQALRKIAQLDGDGLPEHTPQAMVHIANAALANSCDLGVGCDEAGACYAMTDCETCCGSGEIVTDWERYKHPRDGDVGDEAVADCPDCDGNGKVEVPSLAAQDGLVEALEGLLHHEIGHVGPYAGQRVIAARKALAAAKGSKP